MSSVRPESCADCRHFNGHPLDIEAALPGLSSLSSAYAAVRSNDGICVLHDRYVAASSLCAGYARQFTGRTRSAQGRCPDAAPTGRRSVKQVPKPGVLSTLMLPECLSTTMARTIASPCPLPRPTSLVVKKGS